MEDRLTSDLDFNSKEADMTRYISLFILTVSILGCSTMKSGGERTVSYLRGDLTETLYVPLDQGLNATHQATEALRFSDVQVKSDALSGKVTAKDAQDRSIVITLNKESDEKTSIAVRVGMMGDERVANAILDEVHRAL